MSEINKDYKCNVCGNVVKVIQAGVGTLVCCEQPMVLVVENMQPTQPEITAAPETTAAPEIKIEEAPSIQEMPSVPENKPEENTSQEPAL